MATKSKKTKKRNKKYTGIDAKRPSNVVRIRRIDAVVRSDFRQWIYDRRKIIRFIIISIVGLAVVVAGIAALFN